MILSKNESIFDEKCMPHFEQRTPLSHHTFTTMLHSPQPHLNKAALIVTIMPHTSHNIIRPKVFLQPYSCVPWRSEKF